MVDTDLCMGWWLAVSTLCQVTVGEGTPVTMQWNMTGSPGLQLWLDGGMIQVGGTTAWGRLGRQMGRIFTINYEHC